MKNQGFFGLYRDAKGDEESSVTVSHKWTYPPLNKPKLKHIMSWWKNIMPDKQGGTEFEDLNISVLTGWQWQV